MAACGERPLACDCSGDSQPATARHSQAHHDAEEISVTPERVGRPIERPHMPPKPLPPCNATRDEPRPTLQEDEGKRRRLSSEDVRAAALPASSGGGAACPATSGDSADASSASCATSVAAQQPQPLTRAVEDTLRSYLLRWGQRLVDLQPKVRRRVGAAVGGAPGVAVLQPACACCGAGVRGHGWVEPRRALACQLLQPCLHVLRRRCAPPTACVTAPAAPCPS